jgi:hypothetical protein
VIQQAFLEVRFFFFSQDFESLKQGVIESFKPASI